MLTLEIETWGDLLFIVCCCTHICDGAFFSSRVVVGVLEEEKEAVETGKSKFENVEAR